MNNGAWKKLEKAVRELALSGIVVWVMTGPLFEWSMAKLPSTEKMHEIPSAYWKIVSVQESESIRSAAFYFYQDTPKRADYCDHEKPINFIEKKSRFDFFSDYAEEEILERSQETILEEIGCAS